MKLPAMNRSFVPFDPQSGFIQSKRRLPHREQPRCTYFATWRCADSVAQEQLAQWRAEKQLFFERHPRPWDPSTQRLYNDSFPRRLEEWSDQGMGACILQSPDVRSIVVDSLHHFQGERYDLECYVVMPNHVHVIFRPFHSPALDETSDNAPNDCLSAVLHSWKGFTGKRINELLGVHGSFWMDETFDHAIRSEAQMHKLRQYIRDNPVKAGLAPGTFSVWEAGTES
jgi:REP element-mobilizing transposase RayT